MTEMTESPELEIPATAVDAYFVCGCSESGIRAGYKPEALPVVVAAELRRIADEIFDRRDDDNAWWFEDLLRARADELDPPARQED